MLERCKVLSNEMIAKDIYQMEIRTSLAKNAKAGQFIEIEVEGFYLRRPISIHKIGEDTITIIYKILGEGTKALALVKNEVSIMAPLGNGFPIENKKAVIIGGGIGVPPLYELARELLKQGNEVKVVLGFLDASQVILEKEFKELGIETYVTTDNGSYGFKGNVCELMDSLNMNDDFIIYACGPLGMLKALESKGYQGYFSLEQRMACGIGACMGCVVEGNDSKAYRVCKDGPVFEIGKVKL